MGNSATRARVRRSAALVEALRATFAEVDVEPDWYRYGDAEYAAFGARLEAELSGRGLHVADIGGQQVDDDTVHRQETTPCS